MAKRPLTNLVLALVVTAGLMIPSVGAADAPPLTGFAVCPWGSDDCNLCVPDVPGAIRALRNRGDIMGFHIGDTPDPNPFADHWQGVQRTMSGGARYLLVSRSIDPATKDVSFVVVEMATRNDDGLRFRSNRLAPSIDFEFTPPPAEDRVVTIVPREGSYSHAGGMQLLGNVLAVPFESGESTDPPSKVVLFDVSNPPQPVRLANEILHAVPGGISSEAGTASFGKLADGRFLLVIGRGNANNLDFYVSTGSDIRTTAFEFFDTWNEDELRTELCDPQLGCTCGEFPFPDCEFGNYQNLSLVHQCDRALYLVGTHKDSFSGEDFVDLYRLDNVPASNDVAITKVVKRQLVCGYRGENHCDFDAAGGVYIDPERRLLLYGTEHDNDGPITGSPICSGSPCSVKFEEFRPVPHGPCTRIADAWVELYDDTDPDSDRSIIIDFVDRELENYTNYNSIDDFEDKPSHALWCIPERATHRLWEDRDACGGDHRDLVGTGGVEEIGDLGGFETSCSEWIGGPFADAGEDRTVECAGSTTSAQLDGRASVSLGGSLTFSWEAAGIAFDDPSSPTPTGGFPLGATAVALKVEDPAGSDTDAVTVTVADTIAPTIACPADVVADATQPAGAEVNFPAPAATDGCGVSSLVCAPPSGSTFPIGTTTTQCTATDAGGHTAACSFTVKVKSPAEQAADLIDKVNGLTGVKAATKHSLLVKLEAAQAAIAAGKQKAACGKLLDFINEVSAQRGKKELTEAQAADLIADATRIRGALGCS